MQEARKKIHDEENIEKVTPVLEAVETTPVGQINKYLDGQEDALTDAQKSMLDSDEAKEVVKKDIEALTANFDALLKSSKALNNPNLAANIGTIKDILTPEILQKLTLMTDEELCKYLVSVLETRLTDPALKDEQKNIITDVMKAAESDGLSKGEIITMILGFLSFSVGSLFIWKSLEGIANKLSPINAAKSVYNTIKKPFNRSGVSQVAPTPDNSTDNSPNTRNPTPKKVPNTNEFKEANLERVAGESPEDYKNRLKETRLKATTARNLAIDEVEKNTLKEYIRAAETKLNEINAYKKLYATDKETFSKIEAATQNGKKQLKINDQSVKLNTPHFKYEVKVNDTETKTVKLTPNQAFEYGNLIKELEKYNGTEVTVETKNALGKVKKLPLSEEAMEIQKTLEKMETILRTAEPTLPEGFLSSHMREVFQPHTSVTRFRDGKEKIDIGKLTTKIIRAGAR